MAPIIVVFGAAVRSDGSPSGTLARRVRSAWLFGRQFADARYLVTGGVGRNGYAEWQVMSDLLVGNGVSAEQILAEKEGLDTLEQVRKCAHLLRELRLSGEETWISTSTYHQARCWLLFLIFGERTHVVPALPDRFDLPVTKLLLFWARELAALPYDVLLALLRT